MRTEVARRAAFDGAALIAALDAQRTARELRWVQLADALHAQSAELNDRLGGNAMCSGALVRTARRGTMSCQYALTLLRWLRRAPEDFLDGDPVPGSRAALPETDAAHRLRFDLPALHAALDERRRADGLTWTALGAELDCSPARLTNLRTARLADMGLVLDATQWLARPAADFVHPAER